MSLKEQGQRTPGDQAALSTGKNFWSTQGIAAEGIPDVVMTDGPHGLRLQREKADHLGLADSVPATCFPTAATLASSFDPDLLQRVAAAIGGEARAQGVGVVLGPGINIKRSPLCGRNFEYFSEDPLLAGVLGAAMVSGLQSRGVGASVKHFAVNNQEADRMRVSADVAPRALHEIYLRGFERVVRTAKPWTVMCSYNRINGVYASENRWLLTDLLRGQWGFDGVVVSDWGAVGDRVRSLNAGLDLEMPGNAANSIPRVLQGLDSGELSSRALADSADRVAALARRAQTDPDPAAADLDANHQLAREAAARGVVLLKNDDVLPLEPGRRVAVIGEFARTPRYQGSGSSLVNPTRVENLLDELRGLHGAQNIEFQPGYALDAKAQPDSALIQEAVRAASKAQSVIVMVGLPDSAESEGFDRRHLKIPEAQLELLQALRGHGTKATVVVVGGGVVELPFAQDFAGLATAWLGGQASGGGLADVLTGEVNPSGRLAETIPLRLQDTPAALDFPGEQGHVAYGEGIFVGYRWYDARDMAVRYPFGHGLSYTSFEYSNLELRAADGQITVQLQLRNTGSADGAEVVQVYAGLPDSRIARAPRSLGAFSSVHLKAGETRTVSLTVQRSELAYWERGAERWAVEAGTYEISVGASSRDLRLQGSVELEGDETIVPITAESTLAEIAANPQAAQVLAQALQGLGGMDPEDTDVSSLMASFPIGRLPNFPGAPITREQLEQLLSELG